MTHKHMAKLIKEKRIAVDKTQLEVVTIAGLGSTTRKAQHLSNIERGLAGLPIKHWRNIADTLGLTYEELKTAHMKDVSETIMVQYLEGR
jgi:hypothetical protein